MPPFLSAPNRIATAALAVLLLAALVQLLAFWPGIMVWDSIRQYGQALTGVYDDWHPPAMNWLWRQLGLFGRGPAPMLVLQALLYWSGFALLAFKRARDGQPIRTAAIVALALMPVSLVLLGTIIKDSLMASALLLATGLIAWRRPGDRWMAVAAALLLLGAATLRFNAMPACLPLALLLVPERWIATRARLAGVALVAAIPLMLALPLANRLLAAKPSHVELSLVIFDLGGITRYSGMDAFPPVKLPASYKLPTDTSDDADDDDDDDAAAAAARARPVTRDPVEINRACYKPVEWDPYAWWGDAPCPIGFENLKPVLTAPGVSATGTWARAIATHPIAYAAHRFAHFNEDIRFMTDETELTPLSLASDPNPWNYQVPPSRLRDAIAWAATQIPYTPLGSAACWLALAAAVLIAGTGGNRLATALAASSLLYGFSYLPLGVAAEVRYHLWTMIAAGLAAALALGSESVPRWRKFVALALVVAVAAIAGGYRLIA